VDASLVELITNLVLAELGKEQVPSAAPLQGSDRFQWLMAPVRASQGDDVYQKIHPHPQVAWTAIRSSSFPEAGLAGVHWRDTPYLWEDVVSKVHGVVLPVVRLEHLARIATLLSECSVSALALAGIAQGKPVLASSFEVERLKRSSGRLPGPFLSAFHQHLRTVESFGVKFLDSATLQRSLVQNQAVTVTASMSGGRDVLTAEDLEAAVRSGQKVLQLAPGTIVTPLARERASQLNLEVRFG